ncbi:MAG: sigma-70 family RNA polymerase sigma factor [Phycisphaerae bacterium]|nr:sigma-70 family RNA polymerase sigma factor [Phycisphaerae bacterium]
MARADSDRAHAAPAPLSLRAEAGDDPQELSLEPDRPHAFGRDAGNEVVLRHESVSRSHARIWRDGDRWKLIDLGSRHGSFHNDRRLDANEAVELADGDRVVIGPWRWRIEAGAEARSAAATAGAPGTGAAGGESAPSARSDARIAFQRERRSAAETFATRPTIFLRLRSDDAAARELSWREFFDRYAPVIRGYARHAGWSGVEVEDVVQEVMLGFFQVSPKFQYDPERGRFRGYLKRCTLNALRRRRTGAAGVSIEDLDPAEEAATEAPWEAAWAEQAFERALRQVASRIDSKTYEAFELYARRGVPAEEVAARLGMEVNSVHQSKSRVTKLARDALDAIRAEEG